MAYRLIDHPVAVSRGIYEEAVSRMVGRLTRQPDVVAIYQIGSVSTPGISDLDLVVVFEDDRSCTYNPRQDLSDAERYLFIHQLFGVPRSLFVKAQQYSFFHNYKLLWGRELRSRKGSENPGCERLLKVQIALEYLVRMYMSLVLQQTYKVVRLRDFMLHARAVQYDLEFLDLSSGPLHELTHRVIGWRENWFGQDIRPSEVCLLIDRFAQELENFLRCAVREKRLYFPRDEEYRPARCLRLRNGKELAFQREGWLIPAAFSLLGRRYVKLQNRLNRFTFSLPIQFEDVPDLLEARFQFVEDAHHYNRRHLPHFEPLVSSPLIRPLQAG